MTQRKVWVRELFTKSPEFGQYDNLLTELHKEDQRGYKNYLRITLTCSKIYRGMMCTASHWHASSRTKSIYKVEGVLYPENDDAMTSYILSY